MLIEKLQVSDVFAGIGQSTCAGAGQNGNTFYKVVSEARKYAEASAICEMLGGQLATIKDKAENDFVEAYIAEEAG